MEPAGTAPYPEYDPNAGAWQVVEPVNALTERVWWGAHSSRSYMRYTPVWHYMEARNRVAASPRYVPGPIGSRFD